MRIFCEVTIGSCILSESIIFFEAFVLVFLRLYFVERGCWQILLEIHELIGLSLLGLHHLPHADLLFVAFIFLILRRLVHHRFLLYFFNLGQLERVFILLLFDQVISGSNVGRFLIILGYFFKWDAAENELSGEISVGVIFVHRLRFTAAELLDFVVLPDLLVISIIELHLNFLSELLLGAFLRLGRRVTIF